MANTIEACKRSYAKVVLFDSKKGEVRAKIATALIDEWKAGALTAMIARAADFYGPGTPNGLPNVLVFGPFAKNQKASWLANDSVPHSYTYT
jgi:hypothetical protein